MNATKLGMLPSVRGVAPVGYVDASPVGSGAAGSGDLIPIYPKPSKKKPSKPKPKKEQYEEEIKAKGGDPSYKASLKKAEIPFEEQPMPTTGSVLPFINDVYGGKMEDEYVRLSSLAREQGPSGAGVRGTNNYAVSNFSGEGAKGMSQEEYAQYFLNKGKKKKDDKLAQKKNGGWLDEL
jgi:hypothetical protein